MLREVAIGIVICIVTSSCPLVAGTKSKLDRVDHLIASGKYEQALNEVRRLRGALPPSERLTAWEIDLPRGLKVVHGRECLYYLGYQTKSHKGTLGAVSANYHRSGWRLIVVCVALETGRVRWSRAVNGLVNLAVDPRNDVLYLYRERVLALAPDSGKVLEQHDLPEGKRKLQGLLLGSYLTVARPHGAKTPPDARLFVYDERQKLAKEVRAGDYWLLAPDESRRLLRTKSGWDCVGEPEWQRQWSMHALFRRDNLPLWHGGHPVFISGTERQRGGVASVDLLTGEPRWSTTLGWGLYRPHQLRDGSYQDFWTPLTALDEHMLALDGSGRLYMLDPTDGRPAAILRLSRDYLAVPIQYGGQLIVSSFRWIRSYSLANLIRPDASMDVALKIREARCLLALGQQKEALEILDGLVERAPGSSAAWSERAVVCEALDMTEEEAFSRCQTLSLEGRVSDDILRSRWGLLRLHNLEGKPAWTLKVVDGRVYAGTLAGGLWSIRTDSLDFGLAARLDHEIKLLATTTELLAVLGNSTHTRRPIPQASAPTDERIPREWYTEGGVLRISRAVSYRGRQFRSLRGGGVRILSGIEMTDLPSRLGDIGLWKIHLGPSGPLGYGTGVFELDDDLRPIRWLIRPAVGGERAERVTVMFIRSTSKTIGVIVASSKGAALQVYSRQGVLLNEAPLGRHVSSWASTKQLVSVGNGYLFSDRQLVWVSAATDRSVWRFGPSLARTSTERWGDRWRYFGHPLLAHGCIYVTGLDGHLFVFDSAYVTGTSN